MNLMRRHPATLSGYRPRSFDEQFGNLVETMFEDMLAPFSAGAALAEGVATPRLDVTESDQAFSIDVDMPGVRKEDVKISVDRQRLTIEGECRSSKQDKQDENVVYTERMARRFVRSFTLPTDVDDSAAQAHMENGVLHLTLPKKQGASATRIAIQ